jgi:hypothetical protein
MLPRVRTGRGLHKLPPGKLAQMLVQAQDQTVATITRIMLTLLGVSLYCGVSLFAPDSSLLLGGWRLLEVPLAGPVSFQGFLIVGSLISIALRVYLQIYVTHWQRLERTRRRFPRLIRAPALVPMSNWLLRVAVAFALYGLVPLMMVWFAGKAAIFPAWGSGLACVAAVVLAAHVVQLAPLGRPWTSRAKIALAAELAIFGWVIVYLEAPLGRPADLYRADLSNQWLRESYLAGANLQSANLRGANLGGANLRSANLTDADLTDADITDVNQPAFRPDTWHEQGGLGISPSTGLCRTSTVASR